MSDEPAPRRVLLTGANGFVGRHLQAALAYGLDPRDSVLATSRCGDGPVPLDRDIDRARLDALSLDILDTAAVRAAIGRYRPTHLFHLAGMAAVTEAGDQPAKAWEANTVGTIRIAAAIAAEMPDCHLFLVSSSEVYRHSFATGEALVETAPVAPISLYARTKAAAETAAVDIVPPDAPLTILRPFNHTGPGQGERFVVPAFAAQIARAERDGGGIIRVGNLDSERDFLDVSDVASAYVALILRSGDLPARSVFNIASAEPRRIGDVLADLVSLAHCPLEILPDPARQRKSEIPRAYGSSARLHAATGWHPKTAWFETLKRVLASARSGLN